MASVKAVVVRPDAPGKLAIADVNAPEALPSEALVRVRAISLNLGEVRRISAAEPGWRPGWDVAGMVDEAAADGSGPTAGTRVVGMLDSGAWAECVAIPTNRLAELPESVSFAEASTLPVAGLTALRALERGGMLLQRAVLITGASGGVGHLAIQIANAAGARVIGVVRRAERVAPAREAGALAVVTEDHLEEARQYGPYHVILESVGGRGFGGILGMLARNGTCVLYGTSAGSELTFQGRDFYLVGGASLYGFILFHEVACNPPAEDLGRLARMVAEGRLKPQIAVQTSWSNIGDVAGKLSERKIAGKAVLQVD